MNKEKAAFMTDKSNLNGIEEIEGVKRSEKINYLFSKSLATEVNYWRCQAVR